MMGDGDGEVTGADNGCWSWGGNEEVMGAGDGEAMGAGHAEVMGADNGYSSWGGDRCS